MTTLSEVTMQILAEAKAKAAALSDDLSMAPGQLHDLYANSSSALMSGNGVRGFTYLLILLLVGA
ncbi:MAG: hypothetical protein ACRET8_08535, partial [Burkholderiales bacterium]